MKIINNCPIRALFLASALCLASAWLSLIVAQTPGGSGTFTDPRDGKIYKTVKMPDGKTWMAENLNHKTGNSWCYEGKDANCKKYGRLYDWKTAKTACPGGWRLPSREEWLELVRVVDSNAQLSGGWDYDNVAGKKLKAKDGWNSGGNGSDDYGFSALPGGCRHTGGSFEGTGIYGDWWTATEYGSDKAYFWSMSYLDDWVCWLYNDKSYGFSVRCLRD